jgi:cytochrome c556
MGKGFLTFSLITGVTAGILVGAGFAPVRAADPTDEVQHRQDQMDKMGNALYRTIGRYVKNQGGTIDDVRTSAKTIAEIAPTVPDLFPPGTAIGVGKSNAKPEIWQQTDRFVTLAHNMQAESGKMVQAAQSGDPQAVRSQFAALGDACAACHETYRRPL